MVRNLNKVNALYNQLDWHGLCVLWCMLKQLLKTIYNITHNNTPLAYGMHTIPQKFKHGTPLLYANSGRTVLMICNYFTVTRAQCEVLSAPIKNQ